MNERCQCEKLADQPLTVETYFHHHAYNIEILQFNWLGNLIVFLFTMSPSHYTHIHPSVQYIALIHQLRHKHKNMHYMLHVLYCLHSTPDDNS